MEGSERKLKKNHSSSIQMTQHNSNSPFYQHLTTPNLNNNLICNKNYANNCTKASVCSFSESDYKPSYKFYHEKISSKATPSLIGEILLEKFSGGNGIQYTDDEFSYSINADSSSSEF